MQQVSLPITLNDVPESLLVAGVDEAGRGSLAGDVFAAVVILNSEFTITGLTDSKKLTALQREKLFSKIKEYAIEFAIARASVEEIDKLNILQASLLAMKRAVHRLQTEPALVYIDGNQCPDLPYRARTVIKGDSRVAAIAAASILAKVARDREMEVLDSQYPGYGLASHKGYPTKAHLQALQQLGPCSIHRKTFAPVAVLIK